VKLLRVETQMKSVYVIDPVAKTWKRTFKSETSGPTRTEDGAYNGLRLELGEAMLLVCDPITEGSLARLITTSMVTDIHEYEA
jgi:hypothetical protein